MATSLRPRPMPTTIYKYAHDNQKMIDDIQDGLLNPLILSALEYCYLYDPQHYGRQKSLDLITLLKDKSPRATGLFAIRGYWKWDSHDRWSPYGDPVVGPQWKTEWNVNEHDVPDEDFQSYDFFRGHMDAAGWKLPENCLPQHAQKLLPYLFHYSTDRNWKMLSPYQYRPYAWTMQWHDRNWRNRLADYHTEYAKWVESEIPNANLGFVFECSKSQLYWSPFERHRRNPRMPSAPKPLGTQGKTNDLLHFMDSHDWKFNIKDKLDGSHIAFPLTNQAQWLYGVCSLPGKLRHRLDRAGLSHWKVIWQMERMWNGSTYNSLVQILGGEGAAREHIFVNSLKAASNCDEVYWPMSIDDCGFEPLKNCPPWVLQLRDQMSRRTSLVEKIEWP